MNEVDKEIFIGGVKAPSLVDEPGKSVAMVYTRGCNFNCEFCHNSDLIQKPLPESRKVGLKRLKEYLSTNFLIDGFVFTGGEPTLQLNLKHIITGLNGECSVLGMDTNGSNPAFLKETSGLFTRIAMDIKTRLENYSLVANARVNTSRIKESIEFLCNRSWNQGRVEFRTTYAPPLVNEDDLYAIGRFLAEHSFSDNYNSFYVIQQYIPSDGVREEFRYKFKTIPFEEIILIAEKISDLGIPVAIRSQEKGYFELN
ncbi:MAG: radical SAM protein [Promethearchaeota archaeon]